MATSILNIPEFFAGRSVFITGATGFMGKVLVEKLLRSCPEVKTLYLLMRPKKGKSIAERLEEITESQLFGKVRLCEPGYRSKLVPVHGDMLHDGLGLDEEARDTLLEEVSVVFHSAATVRFDEAMKLSVEMNICGVNRMLTLCKKMKKLEAFIHVSTAYANCEREGEIREQIYPPPLHHSKLLSAVEWMDDEALDVLTPKMLGTRPNTYTYTKAVAETLVYEEAGSLPAAIVRPSIVGAAYREPVRGWVDNLNGPTGIFAAIGKGALRIIKADCDAASNIIPVDLAINMTIATAWFTATRRQERIQVYNCTPAKTNNITWGQIERLLNECWTKNPAHNIARLPNIRLTKSAIWHDLNVMVDQMFPAHLMDLYFWIRGRNRTFVKVQNYIQRTVSRIDFFTRHTFSFTQENTLLLLEQMSPADRKAFPFDTRQIHLKSYVEDYCLGIKQFVLKEEMSALPHDRKAVARLQRIQIMVNVALFAVLWRFLVMRVAVARLLWKNILRWTIKIFQRIHRFAGLG